ncbi:MAG: caspase family protein [Myxococcales bacterium]|nr:caspase family protein [Myxococcales bacterium]
MIWFPLAALTTAPAHAGTVRHALVVGANDGGGVLEPLRYAEGDALRMANVLVELGEFDDSLVTVLYRPTQEALRVALARHARIAEEYEDDLFLFYYSGHADGAGLRMGDDRYFFETLQHDLRAIDANVRVGMLDACRSGTITRLKGAAVTSSLFGADGTAAEGEAWLTASAANELAQESETLRGGFFTHYLISGMRGAADTDDGVVALDELYQYTYDRVVEVTGRTGAGTQHPHRDYQLSGAGALQLTDLRNASALLRLRAEDEGQIAVFRLPDKAQLAEFHKDADRQMAIAVPPGKYLVRRRQADATYEATFGLSEGMMVNLDNWGRPVIEFGIARGDDPRLAALVDDSLSYERRLNLGSSPAVAGVASLVLPGSGQFYNRQTFKGIGYFSVSAALMAGAILNPTQEELGSTFWPMLGASLYGASVADAIYNVHRREESRPMTGATVSLSSSYGGELWPVHMGLSADIMLRKGISIGLDRVGYTPGPGRSWDLQLGSRLMVAHDRPRWRPHAMMGAAVRHGRMPFSELTLTRAVFSAGGGVRYYVVPRYFIEAEARWEFAGTHSGTVGSLGMGVHLGR